MIIKIDIDKPNEEIIHKVVEVLQKGGIIVYPTETAYGIGCNAFNAEAIKRIFLLKNRPFDQPLPVIINSLKMAKRIGLINKEVKNLIRKYHPGPLVIGVSKRKTIPDILNKSGIAFRISSCKFIHEIVKRLKGPLVSTSANLTGQITPYSVEDVLAQLQESDIELILDGGILAKNKPSTIIDFQIKPSPQIIREGEIPADEILDFLKVDEKERWKHKNFLK
ncbi:MAG TPA: L-threonylcarbamoyladenylate synthase [Candidatus Bathyarchaeia archaeon]|nr:L-threonylcarbamoyladenylate synthase [Candidatus Bathyarchaeia archaeon]